VRAMARTDRPIGPLLVFGPRSVSYDFGPSHPLTPRRFGPGIELLRAVGAVPGLAPEPASDKDLLLVHDAAYLAVVRAFSADPDRWPEAGIGPGDTPAFAGMHEASAAVAGGSLRATEAILRGDVEHAFHPGGGLHHAMAGRASGFCVYDDVALAIALARREGLRVLYVDLDVHHGDGVESIHRGDPGVLTLSFHESGHTLFPGTGFVRDLGEGMAAGTSLNVPLPAGTGDTAWLAGVEGLVPAIAAAFGPDIIVSQHGADAHAFDPLGHLRVTTTAMGAAARLVDAVAHRWAGGRWLATGGGGYDVYRAVPRAWALVWLAGAHRPEPGETPAPWRERWAEEAARFGQAPVPPRFVDPPNAGIGLSDGQRLAEAEAIATIDLVRSVAVPRLLREAQARGWWRPSDGPPAAPADRASRAAAPASSTTPTIVPTVDAAALAGWTIMPRVVPPLDPAAARTLLLAALGDDPTVAVSAALDGRRVVGLVVSVGAAGGSGTRRLLAVGVAPPARRAGLAAALLQAHVVEGGGAPPIEALVTVAERDPVEPLAVAVRRDVAVRTLARAGFSELAVPAEIRAVDPSAYAARLS
jgi:acetoin utilization protein AcuC